MIDSGFIKLHRSFLQWEWHDDPVRVSVFIHCLLLANWEPKRWHGITIERGTFITSAGKLATICGVSRNTVMKSLKKLQETGEIEINASKRGTKITVVKYEKYQILSGISETVAQPLSNKVGNQVGNKVGNKVGTTKNIRIVRSKEYIDIVRFLNSLTGQHYRPSSAKTKRLIDARMNEGYKVDDFKTVITKKANEWKGTKMETYLRPETLFGTKFESYLNQKESRPKGESLPEYWNANPVRDETQRPASAEEIEKVRQAILKGKRNKDE